MLCPHCHVTMLEGRGSLGGHPLASMRLGVSLEPLESESRSVRRLRSSSGSMPWSCPECFGLFIEGPQVRTSRTVQGVVHFPDGHDHPRPHI